MLKHLSLFTGIGGIDIAAEWAGFETVGQCEWADYPTKILEKHWPDVHRWRDVRDVTVESIQERGIEEITLLSGGFPCQPHSVAGKRQGSNDERDLWGEFARVISEARPRWVLGENVPGIYTTEDGRFFGRVLNDLAQMGYRIGWSTYGAEWVGAPHKRERVFIVAYSNCVRPQRGANSGNTEKSREEVKQQSKRLCEVLLFNPNSITKLQENQTFNTSREKRNPWESVARGCRKQASRSYWEIHQPPILGVDDGVSNRVDRSIALGNSVVPQQVYPILQAIADIEQSL